MSTIVSTVLDPTTPTAHGDQVVLAAVGGLSRRELLTGVAGVTAAGRMPLARAARPAMAAPPEGFGPTGQRPIPNYFHLHGSSSEGNASWAMHAVRASDLGEGVLWTTDHQERMGVTSRAVLHAMSLTAAREGLASVRQAPPAGTVSFSSAGMRLTGGARVEVMDAHDAVSGATNHCIGANLANLEIRLDGLGTFRVVVVSSAQPYAGGKLVQVVSPTYTNTVKGEVSFTPATILRQKPAMPAWARNDIGLCNLYLETLAGTSATLSNLVLNWNVDQTQMWADRQDLWAALQSQYPTLSLKVAMELSHRQDHMNQYGGQISFYPNPDELFPPTTLDSSLHKQIDYAHAGGSLVSFNHPFGYQPHGAPRQTQAMLNAVVQRHLDQRAYGADWIETGYVDRGGASLAQHLWLADNLSAAGIFLPMSGVSDDHHAAERLTSQFNRFATCVYAATTNDTELLAQQKTGRSFQRKLGDWTGQIDMTADTTLMGRPLHVTTSAPSVHIRATQIPTGGKLVAITGPITRVGNVLAKPSVVNKTWTTSTGLIDVTLPSTPDTYTRATVLNGNGDTVGIGQPIWFTTL